MKAIFLTLLFFTSLAFAEDLKILRVDTENHFVVVKPSGDIDDTDLRKYEILLDLGEEVCELKVKKTTDKEWQFSSDGCDDEKPISRNSRIYLELKPIVTKKAEPEKKYPSKNEEFGYNLSLYYNTGSTYQVKGDYNNTLLTGEIDVKGRMDGGAPGITFGVTIPAKSLFEVDAGLGYEVAHKIKSESGAVGGTSLFTEFDAGKPTLKILLFYANLRFYMPIDHLYLYLGYVVGLPKLSDEYGAKLGGMSGIQGGGGFRFSENLSVELGLRVLAAPFVEYPNAIFTMPGFIAALKYEL